MTLKLRRPTKPGDRPRYAAGGPVTPAISRIPRVEDRPEPAHQVATRALINSGVDQPTAQQKSHVAVTVARDRDMGGTGVPDAAAIARAAQMHTPGSSLPPSIQAALALRHDYAAGGVARPAAPFAPAPLPSIPTPGLAAPHGLTAAHHRQHFAAGGTIPPHIAAALALRPHFEDGGDSGEGSSRSSGSSSSGGGDNGGDGHGTGGESSSSSSSGSAGGVGGFGGSSAGDGYGGGSGSSSTSGGNSSSSTASSGSAGGVGGFGGGSNDGYGGGSSSSSSNSNASSGSTSSGSAGGVGGFGGGASDGYGGGTSGGTQSSGGFSSGAASGADGGGDGGSVGGFGGSSATSGPVGSISGSVGAPAAGGFSNEGAASTGGFGSFGATPAATSNPSGLTGVGTSASMMSGQTAGQSMASQAANSAGEAGEDGTASMSGPSTAGAFGSFGPSAQQGFGSPSPYGSMANAQSAFGNSTDGTTGTTPSSVAASNPGALSGLSPSGQMMGVMGMGGIDSGIAAMSNVGTTGGLNGPGAYGLSNEDRPGFDNFSAKGDVTASSFGRDGFEGLAGNPVADATMGNMPDAQGYVGTADGLSPAVAAALAAGPQTTGYATPSDGLPPGVAAALAAGPQTTDGVPSSPYSVPGLGAPGEPMPGLPDYGKPFTPDFDHWNNLVDGVDQTKHPGYVAYGPNGPIGAPSPTSVVGAPSTAATASPYGGMPANPFGATGSTPGLNADGDPTSIGGTSALTIHGDLSPSAQAMSDGVPTTTYSGIAAPAPAAGRLAQNMAGALSLGQDAGVPSFSSLATTSETSPVPTSLTGATTFAGTPLSNITDQEAFNARQNIINGVGTQQDQDTVRNYLVQQNGPAEPGLGLGTPSFAGDTTTSSTPSVAGLPAGAVFGALHAIEGGQLNGQVDPNNPTHYGPAQFSQDTFSDTARAHPDLGIDPNASMFGATEKQYADATQAHWGDIGTALANAGLPDTPGNRYLGWNLGVTGGVRALQAGPDATLAQAGISPAVQRANPSIYGGVSTIGQLQGKLDGMFSGTANPTAVAAAPTSQAPAGLGLGVGAPGTFSPAGASFGQPGEDSTPDAPAAPAPAPLTVTRTITTPTPYSGTSAETDGLAGMGYDAAPARALTIHAFGLQDPANPESPMNAAANIMGLPGDTPINGVTENLDSSEGPVTHREYVPVVSDAARAYAEKQYPGIMDGVQTVGQLRDKIDTLAATAGPPTTSTVTEPSAPATPSPLTISPGPRTTTPFSGYTGADGTSPSFGLNTISAGVPTTINNAGTYGMPSSVGLGQDAQNLAGYSQVPSSVPTLARGILASPGFSPETGFSTPSPPTPDTSAPSATPSTDPTTPDGAPAKHLSVPSTLGNTAAGTLAGAILGGPLGFGVSAVNGLSGLFGGPTLADGINAVLAHPGSPTSVTGSPTSASNSTTSNSDALQQQNAVAPSDGQGGYGSAGAPPTAASAGVSPYDPHAAAMAAYQAALDGMNRGSGTTSSTTDTTDAPRPLVIHPRRLNNTPAQPLYNPMADPAVRHALGLD